MSGGSVASRIHGALILSLELSEVTHFVIDLQSTLPSSCWQHAPATFSFGHLPLRSWDHRLQQGYNSIPRKNPITQSSLERLSLITFRASPTCTQFGVPFGLGVPVVPGPPPPAVTVITGPIAATHHSRSSRLTHPPTPTRLRSFVTSAEFSRGCPLGLWNVRVYLRHFFSTA